jgi:DNA sulfur modification protein DndD
MYISKIELTNFKSYQHAEFNFPEPADGKNIVIIGGLNGYGKTTILEAVYLCLYGKDSLPHLGRAGLKTDDIIGYPKFLQKSLNGEAKRDNADMMSIRIVINRTKTKGIDILRRWFFKTNGSWNDEETIVREINRETPGTPKKDGEKGFLLNELLEEQYVPAHIAPFFFFDGEEVKKLADSSRIEQVKQGLEGLLGVVMLRNLTDRLKAFEETKRSKLSNVNEENLDQLKQTLKDEETKVKRLKDEQTNNQEKLLSLKAERQSFLDRIVSAGGGGGDIATVKDLAEEREQLRSEQKDIFQQLSKILADKLPFYLMPGSLLADFKNQILSEIALSQWQAECRALKPKREKFFDEILESDDPKFNPPLNIDQIKSLEARIEKAWSSLFLPPPPNCADNVIHDYLHDELKQKAIKFLSGISLGQKEIHSLLNSKNDLDTRIDEISRRISRVEGIDRDGTLAELKMNLNLSIATIDALESENGNIQRELSGYESILHNTRAKYENEKQRRDASSPDRKLIERSENTRKIIEEVIPRLFPLKVKQLSSSMTKVYKQLAHKSQVSRIVIDDDGTTRILSANNKELTFDRSAGENQIFATALIAGLAEVSKKQAPLVVDTPLGRLDSLHRDNIFGFWTGDTSRQVILLSQDKEISLAEYKKMKASVCKTYLLEHTDVGDGIGRTVAREDKYFGASA